jgi:hypothetical protein
MWTLITSDYTAQPGDLLLVDTQSGQITITLPEIATTNTTIGDSITIADGNDFSVNSVIVQTTETINETEESIELKSKGSQVQFVWNGTTWKTYVLALQSSKISELAATSSGDINSNDLLLYIDEDGGFYDSKSITYSVLSSQLFDNFVSSSGNLDDLINALNARTNQSPLLNVVRFNNQPASFYLNYNNLNNKPFIPTLTSELTNDAGFLTKSFFNTTTDDLPEGVTNLYFTNDRFNESFDDRFTEKFREFSGDLEETEVNDSFEYLESPSQTAGTSTNILRIPSSQISRFFAGQNLRIYGARSTIDTPTQVNPTISIQPTTTEGLQPLSGGTTLQYYIVAFSYATGELTGNIVTGTTTISSFEDFNLNNYVTFSFNRANIDTGILIYRKRNSSPYILIDVLGNHPDQLGTNTTSIPYIDYGGFMTTAWGGRNTTNGEYTAGMGLVHFPLSFSSAPPSNLSGWVDAVIQNVNINQSRVTLTQNFVFNSTVYVAQDDTQRIQQAINARVAARINFLNINARQYNIKNLQFPVGGNFTLSGKGKKSVLKKLAWAPQSTLGNRMISTGINSNNNQIANITFDGNAQNQYLVFEPSSDPTRNYMLDYSGDSNNITSTILKNMIGGAIDANESTKFSLTVSRIEDSGLSDRLEYRPLIANLSNDVVITDNVFKNFSGAIDLSQIDNGIFSSNIVENCGSGVEIFGSRFFLSSPNVIKGPSNEFIPGPDIFNSDFDSINIVLTPNTDYNSDVYVYQQNGENVNLTNGRLASNTSTENIPDAILSYSLFKLKKDNNVEQLYYQISFDDGIDEYSPIQNDPSANNAFGEFRFRINEAEVDQLLNYYSFSKLKGEPISFIGEITSDTLTVTTIDPNDKIRVGDLIEGTGIPKDTAIIALGTGIGGAGTYTLNKSVNVASIGMSTQKDPDHIGLVYQVELTEYPSVATIDSGVFSIPETYDVVIPTSSIKPGLVVGAKVYIVDHNYTSEDPPSSGPNLDTILGTIDDINIGVNTTTVTIEYPAGTFAGVTTLTGGASGRIHVENTYVLAKGKVQ